MTHRRGRIVAMHVFDAFRTFGLEKDFLQPLFLIPQLLQNFGLIFFLVSNFDLTFADTCITYNTSGMFVKVIFCESKRIAAHVWPDIS